MEYSTRGNHITADLWGVDPTLLNEMTTLLIEMYKAARRAGATVLNAEARRFEPQGVTVLLLLSESHMSIHTYPERGFCALDVYTCGDHVNPLQAIVEMCEVLQPDYKQLNTLERGVRWDERGEGDQHSQSDQAV